MTSPTDTTADKANTIGLPLPNVEVKIVNPDTGKTVAIGEIGEFCTRGYLVMHGYFEMTSGHQGGDRCRRLAAHRRSLRDGRRAATARSKAGSRT